MEINLDETVSRALHDAIREGIKAKLTGPYDNPMHKIIQASVNDNADALRQILAHAIKGCMACAEFREAVAREVRASLAKTLIKQLGGDLEKAVNALKSDPTTRARITLAIEEIAATRSA